jgi:hypothetical protein
MTEFTSKERALIGEALLTYGADSPLERITALQCLATDYEEKIAAAGKTDEAVDLCNDLGEIQSLIKHLERDAA